MLKHRSHLKPPAIGRGLPLGRSSARRHLGVDDDPRRRVNAVAGNGRVIAHHFDGDWNTKLVASV